MSNSGSLDSNAVTEALLCHANTKCRVLSGEAKDKLQEKIRAEGDKRWS